MITLYTKPIPVNQRTMIVRGHQTSSKKWKDTKAALVLETRSQWNTEPLEGMLSCTLHLYFGDKRKRDVDAYIKILLDSMEGICYENDNQINELHVCRNYDKENPRTEVKLLTLTS